MNLVNPVSPFYEFFLSITGYALPSVFMSFFGMVCFVYLFLALYSLFWKIK